MLRWLTDASLADSIAGDLEEQRSRRALTSPVRAYLWFWSAFIGVMWQVARRRLIELAGTSRPPLMRHLTSDVRDALRLFRRAPLFGAAAVFTLALGTGATAAILTLADAALLRPLPVPDVARVVQCTFSYSYLDFRDLANEHRGFSEVAAWSNSPFAIEHGADVVQVNGAAVSGDYFTLAGQRAIAGRLIGRGDDVAGAPATAVVSERLWTRAFRRDPQIVGSTVNINRRPVTIVGISPATFRGLSLQSAPELFVNLPSLPDLSTGFLASPETLTNRGRVFLTIAARLTPGATETLANDEARRLYYSRRNAEKQDTSVWFAPVLTQALGLKTIGDLRRFIAILLGACAVAIVLTCATVANLLLVRSERRQHELAVRTALGAGRLRVCRMLFVESLGIGIAGGLAGIGVATLVLSLLGTFALPGQIAIRDLGLSVNATMLAVCAGLGIITSVIFGLAPILQTRRVDTSRALRTGVRATDRRALRTALVGVQVALCVLLLGGSLAFGRAIAHALRLDLGFNVTETSITAIDPSLARLTSARAAEVRRQALEIVRARPSVRAAAWSLMRPMSGAFILNPRAEGSETSADAKPLDVQANVVTDGYFDVMQIPVISGRAFQPQDAGSAERPAVINASLAKALWPDGQALGRRFSLEERTAPDKKWMTVAGVVGDVRRAIGGPPMPMLYLTLGQVPEGFASPNNLFVRFAGDPSEALPEVRAVLRGIDPHVVVTSSIPMTRHVEAPLMTHRLGLTLFLMFAGLAIALTGFGLYAVVATAVSQRRREIGIRLALGAEAAGVVSMVVRQGLWPIGLGLVAGIASLTLSARVIQSFMFSLPAVSLLTVVIISVGIGILACLSMAVPIRRALSVNPTTILQAD